MKRLLLITLDYPPRQGGVARYLFEMKRYFGQRMLVVTEGLLFVHLWPKWLRALWTLFRLHRHYDMLVISHILPLGMPARLYKRLTGKPYVVILHGMDFALARRNQWKKKLTRAIIAEANLIVTNTESLAREVRGFETPRALAAIYPCLSPAFIERAQRFTRDQSVGRHDQRQPIRFLTVARLVPRKGHAQVLDALARLKSEQRIGAFEYHIVGAGPLGPVLKKHANWLGLTDAVKFIEQADDQKLMDEYETAQIFVMPTEHQGRDIEGFGTVYIEAAAFALPCVAADLPGVDEAVIDKVTGLLVPSSSIEHLAEALERLAADPALCLELGLAGRERALSEFIAQKQFAKLDAAL